MQYEDYYVVNKNRMVKSIRGSLKSLRKILNKYYDTAFASEVIEKVSCIFEELLPKLPYIGGMDNLLTKQIVNTAPYLALYKVLKSKNIEITQIGKIIYDSSVEYWNSYPKLIRIFIRKYLKSRGYLKVLKSSAIKSFERKYSGDFVFSSVDTDKEHFDYGIDYFECGICKYFHEHDADEIMPYICLCDFASSDALKTGLSRTKTIAEGNDKCDFRFKIGQKVDRDLSVYFKNV